MFVVTLPCAMPAHQLLRQHRSHSYCAASACSQADAEGRRASHNRARPSGRGGAAAANAAAALQRAPTLQPPHSPRRLDMKAPVDSPRADLGPSAGQASAAGKDGFLSTKNQAYTSEAARERRRAKGKAGSRSCAELLAVCKAAACEGLCHEVVRLLQLEAEVAAKLSTDQACRLVEVQPSLYTCYNMTASSLIADG